VFSTEGQFLKRIVTKEAKLLAQNLVKKAASPYDPTNDIKWSAAHMMYSLCYGDSHEADDFQCMIDNTMKLVECHKLGNALNFFPWARRLLKASFEELHAVCDRMISMTKRKEAQHLESYKEGHLRDSLDALIRVGVKRPCSLPPSKVMHTVQEFIGAGMDIVYTSLTWAVLYCTKYPHVRNKMVAEIDRVIGGERDATEQDLKSLPYTTAFILETLRYSCVVPMALPHSTISDTTLRGYQIPAGTMVLINLCSVQRDPELWKDPDNFRPERFIDNVTGGIADSVLDNYGAFGFGRRRCIGEQLVKQKLVLYIAVLLQQCRFEDDQCFVDDSSDSGVVLCPKPFTVRVSARS
jgi:cytochrome P450